MLKIMLVMGCMIPEDEGSTEMSVPLPSWFTLTSTAQTAATAKTAS